MFETLKKSFIYILESPSIVAKSIFNYSKTVVPSWNSVFFWKKDNSQQSIMQEFQQETKNYYSYDILNITPLMKYNKQAPYSLNYLQDMEVYYKNYIAFLESKQEALTGIKFVFYDNEKNKLILEYTNQINYLKKDVLLEIQKDLVCMTEKQNTPFLNKETQTNDSTTLNNNELSQYTQQLEIQKQNIIALDYEVQRLIKERNNLTKHIKTYEENLAVLQKENQELIKKDNQTTEMLPKITEWKLGYEKFQQYQHEKQHMEEYKKQSTDLLIQVHQQRINQDTYQNRSEKEIANLKKVLEDKKQSIQDQQHTINQMQKTAQHIQNTIKEKDTTLAEMQKEITFLKKLSAGSLAPDVIENIINIRQDFNKILKDLENMQNINLSNINLILAYNRDILDTQDKLFVLNKKMFDSKNNYQLMEKEKNDLLQLTAQRIDLTTKLYPEKDEKQIQQDFNYDIHDEMANFHLKLDREKQNYDDFETKYQILEKELQQKKEYQKDLLNSLENDLIQIKATIDSAKQHLKYLEEFAFSNSNLQQKVVEDLTKNKNTIFQLTEKNPNANFTAEIAKKAILSQQKVVRKYQSIERLSKPSNKQSEPSPIKKESSTENFFPQPTQPMQPVELAVVNLTEVMRTSASMMDVARAKLNSANELDSSNQVD